MSHEVQVDPHRGTVWINHEGDGSCIGRFSKRFGMDVHKTGTQQVNGEGECLHCTHTAATEDDWLEFIRLMELHYQIRLDPNLIVFERQDDRP